MPLRKQPETLLKKCFAVTIEMFLVEWTSFKNLDTLEYRSIPPNVYDLFANKLIEEYTLKFKIMNTNELTKFLQALLTERLSTLNLEYLVNHTNFIYEDGKAVFENFFLQNLPYLNNLTSLSFKASGKRVHSLPICTDSMMKVIGSSCPNLKSLDISNTDVTDSGISFLIPSADNQGCPLLVKLFVFESYASIEGICDILMSLTGLHFIGFKETGLAILRCHKRLKMNLNLKHLNNIGCVSSSCLNMNQFLYCANLSRIIRCSAPHLEQMKVRVADRYLHNVVLGPKVTTLFLLFSLENVSNPGDGFISLLSSYGHQLIHLGLYCDIIQFEHIMKIGELCKNLEVLDIRCNYIKCSSTYSFSSHSREPVKFNNLDKLFLNVRSEGSCNRYYSNSNELPDPLLCLPELLHSTNALRAFRLVFPSPYVSDSWLDQVSMSINKESLETFIIELPANLQGPYRLNLTLVSVSLVLNVFPNLKNLGNLSSWSVTKQEIDTLILSNRVQNLDVNIITKPYSKYIQENAIVMNSHSLL